VLAPQPAAALATAPALGTAEPAAPREAEPEREVRLRIEATPPGAELYLDGQRLGLAPLDRSLRADDRPHEIVARASGYADALQNVRLDADVIMTLSLSPLPAAAPPTAPEPEPAAKPGRRPPGRAAPRKPAASAPAASEAAAPEPAPEKAPTASCTPPYTIGSDGLRHFRPECL